MLFIKLESPFVKSISVLHHQNISRYCDYPCNSSKYIKQGCWLKSFKIKQDARQNLFSITFVTTWGHIFGRICLSLSKEIVFLQIKGFRKNFARIYLREFDFLNNFRALIFISRHKTWFPIYVKYTWNWWNFQKKEQLVNTQRIVSRLFWEKCKKQISKSKDTYYEYLIHFQIRIWKKRKLF